MAAEGFDLVLTATDASKLGQVAAHQSAARRQGDHPHLDLSKLENVKALADAAGDCDILVNNAGAVPRG